MILFKIVLEHLTDFILQFKHLSEHINVDIANIFSYLIQLISKLPIHILNQVTIVTHSAVLPRRLHLLEALSIKSKNFLVLRFPLRLLMIGFGLLSWPYRRLMELWFRLNDIVLWISIWHFWLISKSIVILGSDAFRYYLLWSLAPRRCVKRCWFHLVLTCLGLRNLILLIYNC